MGSCHTRQNASCWNCFKGIDLNLNLMVLVQQTPPIFRFRIHFELFLAAMSCSISDVVTQCVCSSVRPLFFF